uniref:PH domain-containing protein n=1 Tax=Chrysotila carterae TaxID=13221 RepID=A0A6S9Y046_CHRCT|mmetsp:Transcript_21141/g.41209  ORF Transcript_21141/g.41209 Transcript_21141/m.41209 type:complete len:204 (+) Transcript_21141:212-823(+)
MWRRPSASKPGFNGAIAMPAFYGDSYRDECADPGRGDGGASAEWREDSFTGKQTERDGSETSDLSLDVPNESDIIKQGNLRKRSAAAPRVWQARFVVLERRSLLYYDARPRKGDGRKRARGALLLDGCAAEPAAHASAFKVITPGRTYEFRAADASDAAEWVAQLNQAARDAKSLVGWKRDSSPIHTRSISLHHKREVIEQPI